MTENRSFLDYTLEGGAKKAGETLVNRALNAIVDYAIGKYGEGKVVLGSVFLRYLTNATERYNKVRTLATGTEVRSIIGQNSIYVNTGVIHHNKHIRAETVEPLLRISKNLLILGTGGIGKSMLLRYLFLNTADRGGYVPILLELRKIDKQVSGSFSIIESIYNCLSEFDAELPREQFEYSLRLGKYLFLFDGFDEVKEAHSTEIAEAIQSFCSKYPQNPCIITSRPKLLAVAPLETFTTVEAMPLTKEQAITLASKIWPGEEKTIEFCKQLDESLFEKYKDFAETPLLLSMMFLTFMRNNSVPDHLADFYQKAYDALYCTHDSQNKGFFRRDFQCYTLIEGQFKMLFSHFCFHTYFDEVYEFTKEEIISYLKKSIERYKLASVTAEAFLSDLQFVVCLIIQDGECFRFSHRSFQTYFAAYYSANVLTDEEQQNLYKYLLSQTIFLEDDDYYSLLFQLQPERFSANVLEKGLKELKESLVPEQDPDKAFLKKEIVTITAGSIFQGKPSIMLRIPSASQEELYRYNLIELFSALLYPRYSNKASLNENCNGDTALKVKDIIRKSPCCTRSGDGYSVLLADLDITTAITDEERDFVYEVFIKEYEIHETRMAIMHWLSELENKRDSLSRPGFIDDL